MLVPAEPAEGGEDRRNGLHLKFDFGTRSSPVANGYRQVVNNLLYARGLGYGWESEHEGFARFRTPREFRNYVLPRSWVFYEYQNNLTMDGVRDAGPMTFMADVPNGSYRVRVVIGDLNDPVHSINITAEGQQAAGELDAWHILMRSVYYQDPNDPRGTLKNYGFARPYWFDVNVTDGRLDLTFYGDDSLFRQRFDAENQTSPPNSWSVWMSTGTIRPGGSKPPYRYIGGLHTYNSILGLEVYPTPDPPVTRTEHGLVLNATVTNTTIRELVDRYNLASTFLEYNQLGQDIEEAIVDAETGEYTDRSALLHLLAQMSGDLAADWDVDGLGDMVTELQALHNEQPLDHAVRELLEQARRYTTALNYIFKRIETGKNHFYENDKGIGLLWTFQEGDPFYPTARLWLARALFMLDPHRWTSASGTAKDVMNGIRPLDPDNKYIRFYLDTTLGEPPKWEDNTPIISTTGKRDYWRLEDPNEGYEHAPEWARVLHEELYWLYDITDWWVLNRQQPSGALGGGWTDDVEMIGLFGFDALISQGAGDISLEGARRFVDGMLKYGGVDLERGYSIAMADAEHTAELTGDSLPMMIAVDYGNPKWIEFSMKTGILMRDLWMGTTVEDHLHFKSNYLSATRIGGTNTQEDAYINYRATLPASWAWWYNANPDLDDLFVRWATAWAEDGMRTDDGKPQGVIPASIGFEGDELGGRASPNWYTANHPQGTVNYDWQPQKYKAYLVTLLRTAYEATGNESILEPLKLEAQLAQAYLDDPIPDPTRGSAAWAGKVLGAGAVSRWETIKNAYGLEGASGGSGEKTGFSRGEALRNLRMGHGYVQKCYPLITTEASATDRALFIGVINPFMIATGGGIGGAMLAPQVTYTGLGRDFAATVIDAGAEGFEVLLYGFYKEERQVGVVPWALELGGKYSIKVGPDANQDEVIDSVEYESDFVFLSRGQEVKFPMPGDSEQLVVVEQLVPGTGTRVLLPDLATTEAEVNVSQDGAIEVVVHNIGSANATDFTVMVKDPAANNTVLGKTEVLLLEPPKDLLPSIVTIQVWLNRAPVSGNVTVVLLAHENQTEITLLNNEVTVAVNVSALVINGAPLYVGADPLTFEVEEDEAPPRVELVELGDLWDDPDPDDTLSFSFEWEERTHDDVNVSILDGSLGVDGLPMDWNGEVTFRIVARDTGWDGVAGNDDDLLVSSPIAKLVVSPVNDPPRYVPGAPTGFEIEENGAPPWVYLIGMHTLWEDPDMGDVLTYEIVWDNRGHDEVVLLIVEGDLGVDGLPDYWSGVATFRIVARDQGQDGIPGTGDELEASTPIMTLTVIPVNNPPVPQGEIKESDFDLYWPYGIDLTPFFFDVDGDVLYYVIAFEPEGVLAEEVRADPTYPIINLTIIDGDFRGNVTITFWCYDRNPVGSAEPPGVTKQVFVLELAPNRAPHAPVVSKPTVLTVEEGKPVTFEAERPFDPDGDRLWFRWDFGDGNDSLWSEDSQVVYTYTYNGTFTVTLWVSDRAEGDGLLNSTSFPLLVEPSSGPDQPDDGDDGTLNVLGSIFFMIAVFVIILIVVVLSVVIWFVSKQE
jgi:hypothetical protein